MSEHQVIRQVLSKDRAATRRRLIEAALTLAAAGGYDGVGMRETADQAGLSAATAYAYFASKDQLLVEAMAELGERSVNAVQERAPQGATPAEAVTEVFRRTMREVERKPLLYQTLFRAYASQTPGARPPDDLARFWPQRQAWIGEAVRSAPNVEECDADDIAQVLALVFLGGMVAIAAGKPAAEVADALDAAVRLTLSN